MPISCITGWAFFVLRAAVMDVLYDFDSITDCVELSFWQKICHASIQYLFGTRFVLKQKEIEINNK